MIPVPPLTEANEPRLYDWNCRQPGNDWLRAHPDLDPHVKGEWWREFQPQLARHFEYRCGWLAMSIGLGGQVDHWLACGPRGGVPSPNRHLAFEWSNLRYIEGAVNSRKQALDDRVLDPCEVGHGWFEVLLPSFQLIPTSNVPEALRERARLTVEKLQLRAHSARWTRWTWYRRYWQSGRPDLDALRRDAPLVAVAVEKALARGERLPNPEEHEPPHAPRRRIRPYKARRVSSAGDGNAA